MTSRELDLQALFRRESGKLLSGLIREVGSLDLAQDVLQDAMERAFQLWPTQGTPQNPAGWLYTTARRKAIDQLRRQRNFASKREEMVILAKLERSTEAQSYDKTPEEIPDERLRLMFTCCHPALSQDAQVALTLRTLGGLKTLEIARAFLVKEASIAQRIVRAKRKIRTSKIPYKIPGPDDLPERLSALMSTLYLIFNEGYVSTSGKNLTNVSLVDEAIRLARTAANLLPHEPELLGLLSLMLLHDARRPARTGTEGELIPLDKQDRTRWSESTIREGLAVLGRALARRKVGPYQVQAAISALHAEAKTAEETDWPQIAKLYEELARRQPSPVVELNRAVALSMAHGPEAGLPILEHLGQEGQLKNYQPYYAAKADLLRRAGAHEAAGLAYQKAIELSGNAQERAFLAHQQKELGES